ncbi:hypothetical protein ACIQMP_22495 [Streptomyces sp. NPDC091385]|uniref:hypothetical protein n=1 Tax=Streptomyces sp. NPDC091385 TaxID=3365997 RepID=UPI00381538DD
MDSKQPLPREVKAVDTPTLIRLEERACELRLSQRLDPAWVAAEAAPDGTHYLWPVLWHTLFHRPEVPRHLRCELLVALHEGDRVVSLLDVLPDEFASLVRVTSRDEGLGVARLLDTAPSVREWMEGEDS